MNIQSTSDFGAGRGEASSVEGTREGFIRAPRSQSGKAKELGARASLPVEFLGQHWENEGSHEGYSVAALIRIVDGRGPLMDPSLKLVQSTCGKAERHSFSGIKAISLA